MNLIIPENYDPVLSLRQTQEAIKYIRDTFQKEFGRALMLERISAPLFVQKSSGLNDNLNGVERPVGFDIKGIDSEFEIVHSLAKWKRMSLARYNFEVGTGLYTDMNAIRRDEDLDNLHSVYVDQWDWEKIISKEERTVETLKETVKKIYGVFKKLEDFAVSELIENEKFLPDEIFFITTQELEDKYPNLTPKEREDAICKEHKAVFIMKIGDLLNSGEKHDGRAPDYDDWSLNGDIIFWYPVLERAFEVSSMGIRVDEKALEEQLKKAGCEERKELDFHKNLLEGKLPYTIGGGIGQSRMCMYFLRKAHIGEVQASVWDEKNKKFCEKYGITLL